MLRPLAAVLALALSACDKPVPPPPHEKPPPAPPSKLAPALTRPLVMAYVASLLDPDLPQPATSPSAGPSANAASLARDDAFAKKYGFRDFADYAESRRRVMLAKLAWMKRGLAQSSAANLDLQIKLATETLLNPEASEDEKKTASASLNRAMELKRTMEAPSASSVVAEEDIALVGEFADQIAAAEARAAKR